MKSAVFRFFPVGLAFVCLAGGCGEKGPPRYHVSGTVTYKGDPVPSGSIVFQPLPSSESAGVYGTAPIKEGKFDTRLGGEPFSGGPQIVIVEAFDGKNINADYAPYGHSLGNGYQKRHDLPEEDTTLNIELTDR